MASPCDLPGLGHVCHGAGDAVRSVASSGFDAVVEAFTKGLADVMKALMTFWIHTPDPDLSSGGVVGTVDQLTRPLVAFFALIGLLVAGVKLAVTARHGESGRAIMRGILLTVVVTGAGATIVEAVLTGCDALAVQILDRGFDGKGVGASLTALATLPNGVGSGLLFILAFLGIIASIVQVGVMLVRGAILAILVGILPIAAAASITDTGATWFKKLCGWIASFTVYKLCAAIIYAAAFALIGDGANLVGVVSGFGALIVAILALPALLRLLPPSAEAMSGGGGVGMGGVIGAAATGAISLAGSGSGGGSSSSSSSGSPGLSGPSGSGDAGSSGSSGRSLPGPSGADGKSGGGGSSGSPGGAGAAGSTGGAGAGSAGSAGAGGASAGAAGGAAAAGGPAGVAIAAGQKAYSGSKQAANGAVGSGEQ